LDSLFLDTNIPIGFCYSHDPQHSFAKKLFKHSCKLYWYNNVKYEFDEVFERKRNAFEDLIFDLIDKVNNFKTKLSKEDFINIAFNLNNKFFNQKTLKKLLMFFWEESNLLGYVHHSKIVLSLNMYKRSFIKKLLKDKSFCFKKMSHPHERQTEYPLIEQQLTVDGVGDLSRKGFDMNICLDAHDLGLVVNKLIFITHDIKILEDKSKIENNTKIYKVLGINDYEFT
jgi:hypothetical protein